MLWKTTGEGLGRGRTRAVEDDWRGIRKGQNTCCGRRLERDKEGITCAVEDNGRGVRQADFVVWKTTGEGLGR